MDYLKAEVFKGVASKGIQLLSDVEVLLKQSRKSSDNDVYSSVDNVNAISLENTLCMSNYKL